MCKLYGSHALYGKIGTCTLLKQTFPFSYTNWSEQEVTSMLHVHSVTPDELISICYASRKNHAKP